MNGEAASAWFAIEMRERYGDVAQDRWPVSVEPPGRDDQVRELPRWRDFLVDASDLAPGTIPYPPSAVPDVRVDPPPKGRPPRRA
ncbi:hypothetical protein EN745_00280 [Mesorhizobium sp. M4A.F.Ca.ET.022.05.2.1]|nr:hypothetical protein EN745_00280 [Mesorhizobium sp. M4A.F.Ca.ET.022.05.2.1]